MQEIELDSVDRRLLHALQIEPRASWNVLAPVVGVDASTLARRWARLNDEGIAWITGHPMRGQLALIEIDCELTHLEAITNELRHDPCVYVLDFSSGSRDLLALVVLPDLPALSEYAVGRLGMLAGIRTIRTHLANEVLIDGRAGAWARSRPKKPHASDRPIRPGRGPRGTFPKRCSGRSSRRSGKTDESLPQRSPTAAGSRRSGSLTPSRQCADPALFASALTWPAPPRDGRCTPGTSSRRPRT